MRRCATWQHHTNEEGNVIVEAVVSLTLLLFSVLVLLECSNMIVSHMAADDAARAVCISAAQDKTLTDEDYKRIAVQTSPILATEDIDIDVTVATTRTYVYPHHLTAPAMTRENSKTSFRDTECTLTWNHKCTSCISRLIAGKDTQTICAHASTSGSNMINDTGEVTW